MQLKKSYRQQCRAPLGLVQIGVDRLQDGHVDQIEAEAQPAEHPQQGVLQQLGRSKCAEKCVPIGEH